MLTLTWDNHNRIAQADQRVAYDDGDTGREAGQQTVVEWRFRADPGDDWGLPTRSIGPEPNTASYDPPADGWVEITVYSIRAGLTSWQSHQCVVPVEGGDIVNPQAYEDEATTEYADEDGEQYKDA